MWGKQYRWTKPSPRGEGKEEAASPQKRKPTPPRCARQSLPGEGARVDTPTFKWKEVPRRGGGWMGESGIPDTKPFPMGKAAKRGWRYPRHTAFSAWGRQRGSGFAAKKEANPASLHSAAPSKGRGSRGHSLLPMEGGSMPPHRLPTKKAYDTRMPLSRIVISSESEKSFSFAVRQRM